MRIWIYSGLMPLTYAPATITAAAAVAIVGSLNVTPAAAQSDWQATWKKTIAAAEKEGTVTTIVQPNRRFRDYVSKQWPKDFPNIKLTLTTMRSRQFLAKVRTERKVGKFLWDAAYTGSFTAYALAPLGAIDPLRPEFVLPEVKDPKAWGGWKSAFYDNAGKFVISTQSYIKSP